MKDDIQLLKKDLKLFSTIILILSALFLTTIALWLVADKVSELNPTLDRVVHGMVSGVMVIIIQYVIYRAFKKGK